jgi:LysM repeat protein
VKKWNKLKTSTLKAGQSLKIKVKVKKTIAIPKVTEPAEPENKSEPKETSVEAPPAKSTPPKTETPKTTPKEEFVYYTVKSGDSLSTIASKHKVSVDAIIKLNKGITPNKIKTGQKLKIKKK